MPQGLPVSGNGLGIGARFSTARALLRSPASHRLAAASSARTGLQARTGAAAGLAQPALCTEFSTEIVETAAETFAGAPRCRRDGRVACRRPANQRSNPVKQLVVIGASAGRRERALGARRAPAAGLRRAASRRPAHRRAPQHPGRHPRTRRAASRGAGPPRPADRSRTHLRRRARPAPARHRRHVAPQQRRQGAPRPAGHRSAVPVRGARPGPARDRRAADRQARRRHGRPAGDQGLRRHRHRAGSGRRRGARHAGERAARRRGRSLRHARRDAAPSHLAGVAARRGHRRSPASRCAGARAGSLPRERKRHGTPCRDRNALELRLPGLPWRPLGSERREAAALPLPHRPRFQRAHAAGHPCRGRRRVALERAQGAPGAASAAAGDGGRLPRRNTSGPMPFAARPRACRTSWASSRA